MSRVNEHGYFTVGCLLQLPHLMITVNEQLEQTQPQMDEKTNGPDAYEIRVWSYPTLIRLNDFQERGKSRIAARGRRW